MNTKKFLSLVFVASLFITSCKKELKPQDSSDSSDTLTKETIATPENAIEVTPQATPTTTTTPAQPSTTATTTAAGMNPPHGQPGHRCDIAVGAPLNSPKAPAVAPHNAPKPTNLEKVAPKTAVSQPVTTQTAPGMNPPHGQPGHKCEIAVGAPLPTE